jgi:hypothetical protein
MGASIERQGARRLRAAQPRRLTALSAGTGGGELRLPGAAGGFALLSEIRLPPPRAARTARSRGIFLRVTDATKEPRGGRKPGASIVRLVIAVAAIACALVVAAPGAIMWTSGNPNPGPAMVGATSVPPSFVDTAGAR